MRRGLTHLLYYNVILNSLAVEMSSPMRRGLTQYVDVHNTPISGRNEFPDEKGIDTQTDGNTHKGLQG